MRTLNRPMFRYGGPIKEGVMHGIREPAAHGGSINEGVMHGMRSNYAGGQRVGAFNVGSPVKGMFPKDVRGREHHVAPAIGAGIWYGAQGLARLAPALYRAIKGAKNVGKAANIAKNVSSTGRAVVPYTGGGTGGISGSYNVGNIASRNYPVAKIPQAAKGGSGVINKIKDWFKADPLYTSVAGGTTALGRGIKWTGKKAWDTGKYATTTPSGLLFFGAPVTYAAGKYFLSDGKEIKGDDLNNITQGEKRGVSGAPGGGDPDMTYTAEKQPLTAEEKEAIEAENRIKQMDMYKEIMDIKGMKKDAVYKSLIDVSKQIQEGGSLKEQLKSGSLISNLTQAASKRFDKVADTETALRSLVAKGEIENELNKDDKDLKRKALKTNIAIGEKTLAGDSFDEAILKKITSQQGRMPTGNDLAGILKATRKIDSVVLDGSQMKKPGDEIKFVQAQVDETIKKGNPLNPGYYVINDKILIIDEQGAVTKYW